jgi:RNA polymerase sigma-70 factor (ECF subfamily)
MNDPLSDEVLMTRVREGGVDALGVLFDRYCTPLFNFFCRMGNDRAASDDLVQDVFYRILTYRHSYKPGSAFRSWIYKIARADLFHARPQFVELDEAWLATVEPIDGVEAEQQIQLLRRALLQLAEEKREVLVLSRYQDMKYDQIAAVLNCQVGTVKVRVHRALQELKEIVRRLEKEPTTTRGLL